MQTVPNTTDKSFSSSFLPSFPSEFLAAAMTLASLERHATFRPDGRATRELPRAAQLTHWTRPCEQPHRYPSAQGYQQATAARLLTSHRVSSGHFSHAEDGLKKRIYGAVAGMSYRHAVKRSVTTLKFLLEQSAIRVYSRAARNASRSASADKQSEHQPSCPAPAGSLQALLCHRLL